MDIYLYTHTHLGNVISLLARGSFCSIRSHFYGNVHREVPQKPLYSRRLKTCVPWLCSPLIARANMAQAVTLALKEPLAGIPTCQ